MFIFAPRNSIQKPSKRVTEDGCEPHGGPYQRPAIIAPGNSVTGDQILRKDFGKECDGECREKNRGPFLVSMPEALDNERQ
jgi:hypothetical protein